ncbi:MAG: glycosyltransferase family 39 protein [Anaerolineaceae bacterium]|nr:glycosyltransferase family 39 protein [Anaerolineaceae bacterium]
MRPYILLLVAGLLVRVGLALLAEHPGLFDPNHYYNLARNLAEGRGFVVDYIWQYHQKPTAVTHPVDYRMPLAAVWPALSMRVLGIGLLPALLPNIVFSTALVAFTGLIARVARLSRSAELMAMALILFLPDFVLGAVRTDTTVSYALFCGMALLCLYRGMQDRPWLLALAGACGALAQLTRLDGVLLLPALLIGALLLRRFGERPVPWRWLLALPLAWTLVLSPWLWRNQQDLGTLWPAGPGNTPFLTHFDDQFSYSQEHNLESFLAWGPANILKNIAFHSLANLNVMVTTQGFALPLLALLGLGGWLRQRHRGRLQLLCTPLLFLLALYGVYSVILPFHSMGGSFKKSWLALIPFLAVAGAWALDAYLRPRRMGQVAAILIAGFMLMQAIQLVRSEYTLVADRLEERRKVAAIVESLGDQNGDGQVILMTDAPFFMNWMGYKAVMIPNDDRDTILHVARRYAADMILMPALRDALWPLYDGSESDERLPLLGRSSHSRLYGITEA